MESSPKISVIIPLYNRKSFIRQAVNSVLAQDFDSYEIIILDNQSTDGGYELCQELYGNNPKVNLIRQNFRCGLGAARNMGISLARGKYIAFLDSDDMYAGGGLKLMYAVAEANQAEVVHAPGYLTSKDDGGSTITAQSELEPVVADHLPLGRTPKYLVFDIPQRLTFFVHNQLCFNAWSKLYLKEYLVQNNITFADILNEDVNFLMLNLLYAERYVRAPVFWNIYRISPDSLTFGRKSADFLPKLVDSLLIGLKHMNENFQRCPFIQQNPQFADILRNKFLTMLLNFHLFREQIYLTQPQQNLTYFSKEALKKYFSNDQLEFVNVLFNFVGMYQAQTVRLINENQKLQNQLAGRENA